jgi:hypothetical protein
VDVRDVLVYAALVQVAREPETGFAEDITVYFDISPAHVPA